jgi:dihydrofolate synthase / folylpolyglutamate synthase
VLGEREWVQLAREREAGTVVVVEDVGRAAAEALLGRQLGGEVEVSLPGRLDFSGDDVFAGAHNAAGVEWLVRRLPRHDYVVCASILDDKDARAMLEQLARVGSRFVATEAETERTVPAEELALAAREFFSDVESVRDATKALDRARAFAGSGGAVLVTGSLYLVRDLFGRLEPVR